MGCDMKVVGVLFFLSAFVCADPIELQAFASGQDGSTGPTSQTSTALPTAGASVNVGGGSAQSSINSTGTGTVTVEGLFGGGNNHFSAFAVYRQEITNTTGITQNLRFDFTIVAPYLYIMDFALSEADDPSPPEAGFAIDFDLDGVSLFDSAATVRGGSVSRVLVKSGTDLGGTFNEIRGSDAGPIRLSQEFEYLFSGLSSSASLGSFAAGETKVLTYRMRVFFDLQAGETGAQASIGDPFGLSGFTGEVVLDSPSPNPIPEPGTWSLLGIAALGLLFYRRRLGARS